MINRLVFCFLTLLLGDSLIAHAQSNTWTVRGKVLEATKAPLEFVNVYVNNTSIGTTTKADGSFLLNVPKTIQRVEIVVSFIGYNSIKKVLTTQEMSKTIVFILEGSTLLKEVKVTAKRDKDWKKKWRIFKDGLLGDSQFTTDCEILNPNAIKLTYDKKKNVVATANEPIFVQNNGLGYKIMFQMETFISDGKLTFFAGDKFFETLTSKDERQEKRWNKFRKRAYRHSFRNFLVSLSQNKLHQNGFEVFKEKKIKDTYLGRTSVYKELRDSIMFNCSVNEICSFDSLSNRFTLHSDKPLLVFLTNHFNTLPIFSDYPYKLSQIVLPNGSLEFTQNGWVTVPNGMILRNFWGNEGFSSLLPDDYADDDILNQNNSPETLVSLYAENEQKFWFISGKVTDANGIPVESADVFINQTQNGAKTNSNGSFTLKVPDILKQPELLVTHPKFYTAKNKIDTKGNINQYKISLQADNFQASNEKDKEFQRNWKIFSKVLLGDPSAIQSKTQFPESCEITNPELISFEQDGNKRLKAKASKPLFITNKALGYAVTYQLTHFESDGKDSSIIKGDMFFEKLTPADNKQALLWKRNQLRVYQESFRYFLSSLSHNKLKENGFEVFKMASILDNYDALVTVESQIDNGSFIPCKASDLYKFDPQTNRFYLHSELPLLIFLTKRTEPIKLTFKDYPYKRSQIVLPNFSLEFAADGTITNYNDVELRDFWGNEGISSTLPNDFSFDEQSNDRISFETLEELSPRPILADSTNRFDYNGIGLNRSQVELVQEKSYASVPTDFNVRIYEKDENLTIYDLLRRIPSLVVRLKPETGDYFIGFAGAMSFQSGMQTAALLLDNYFTDDASQINNLLSTLQVRDIETLGAIKYSSGAAFGSRGANGVIVITTKK